MTSDESEELYSLLCDALWKHHVSETPEEFHIAVAEAKTNFVWSDGMPPPRHTSDVSRAAATHIVKNILGIEFPTNSMTFDHDQLDKFQDYIDRNKEEETEEEETE